LEGDVFNWKMPEFDLSEKGVDQMMKKVGKHKALILDLRGNGGGYEETLQYLLGYFFDRDVKIGDRKGRKESKPIFAKTRGAKAYKGQLLVLVDSRSASAAELFARIVQLEKRGTVLGDHTAGAVTEARHFPHEYVRKKGFLVSALAVTYAVSVTVNDLIMADGKSLERVGVTPDEIILPSPQDLAEENDPVLVRAAELAGSPLNLKKTKPDSFQKETTQP
jgi:carboxyl-terminal processing protease